MPLTDEIAEGSPAIVANNEAEEIHISQIDLPSAAGNMGPSPTGKTSELQFLLPKTTHRPRGRRDSCKVDLASPLLSMECYYVLLHSSSPAAGLEDVGSHSRNAERLSTGENFYQSDVTRGTVYPHWASIPPDVVEEHASLSTFLLDLYYSKSFIATAQQLKFRYESEDMESIVDQGRSMSAAAPPTLGLTGDVRAWRFDIDMTDTVFLGVSIEEADSVVERLTQPTPNDGGASVVSPLLYLLCRDGVLVPRSCLSKVAVSLVRQLNLRFHTFSSSSTPPLEVTSLCRWDGTAPVEVPWSISPAGEAWRSSSNTGAGAASPPTPPLSRGAVTPRSKRNAATLGDVKSLTTATLAWHLLTQLLLSRRRHFLSSVDHAMADPFLVHQLEQQSQCAQLQVRLSSAREQLTLSTLELERMCAVVEQRQRQLLHLEDSLEVLQSRFAAMASPENEERVANMSQYEELKRSHLRAALARCRQQRTQELALLYSVQLSSRYGDRTCQRASDAKDSINKVALPIVFSGRADIDAASHLLAYSSEELVEEATALGYAGHLLMILSVIYAVALPHPILYGGTRSCILSSPQVQPEQLLGATLTSTEARRYPLFCLKAAERPLMMAGVHLLLRNCAFLASAMGKTDRRTESCSDRLGVFLHLLLTSKS